MLNINDARIALKHAPQEVWENTKNFIPYKSEMIVYDIDEIHDYPRFKLGDGVTNINDLPFVLIQNFVRINTWEEDD
jgi:hypothetical protein